MSATSYARLAAIVFTIVAVLQLARAIAGWPVAIDGLSLPVWPSWVAGIAAAALAWFGFTASRG